MSVALRNRLLSSLRSLLTYFIVSRKLISFSDYCVVNFIFSCRQLMCFRNWCKAMWPDHEYVIDEPFPKGWAFILWWIFENVFFNFSHKDIGIVWCKWCTHACAVGL